MLARVGRVAVLAGLGIAGFLGGSLVRATAGAENAVRDVLRAMVTLHEFNLLTRRFTGAQWPGL